MRWSRQPLTRVQVIGIWAFVALLLLITRSDVAWLWFEVASAAAAAFFLWPFIQGPYLLYTRHVFPLHQDFQIAPAPVEASPQDFRIRHLHALGFQFAARLVQKAGKRNIATCVDIFIHPQNQDSAQLGQIFSGLNKHYLVIFKARFEDGFAFETSNGYTPSPFKPNPDYQVFRFPQVRSTGDQYRLHRKIKEQFLASHCPAFAEGDGEVTAFIEQAEIAHQRHVQSGHYKLAPSGEYYAYNLKGAIVHAWVHAWPIKRLRTNRIYSRAYKMIRELGFSIHPKFGRLEELNPPSFPDI